MAHTLFDLLENSGFIKGNEIIIPAIASAKRSRLVEIADQSAELTATASIERGDPFYSHTASPSMSGGPFPCSAPPCRLKKANELVHFSAFYSDKVYISNGLFNAVGHSSKVDKERLAFAHELKLLLVFRPLIEAGIIIPVTPTKTLCYHCLGKEAVAPTDQARFDQAFRLLKHQFSEKTKVSIKKADSGRYNLHIEGDEELVEHGGRWHNISQATLIPTNLDLRLSKKKEIKLPKALRVKWGIDSNGAHAIFNEIGFEMAVSQCLNSSIVTNDPLHIDIIKNFRKDDTLERRNSMIQKHLTCIVPFLADISTENLLKLRMSEGDSFISFRRAFSKAIDEHMKKATTSISERDAQAIYRDIVEPELARLNKKVSSANRLLNKGSNASMLGWVAAISVGAYCGFVDSSLIAAAKALGLTKVAADLITNRLSSTGEDSITDEGMYYLWKVRHRSQST